MLPEIIVILIPISQAAKLISLFVDRKIKIDFVRALFVGAIFSIFYVILSREI